MSQLTLNLDESGFSRRTKHICDQTEEWKARDVAHTPDHIAAAIIRRYKPTGSILDPCRGDGAFWRQLPDADWCEISEGRDFFAHNKETDWIVGNPPYSILNRWLEHSFKITNNMVYLLPIAKIFGSLMRLRMIQAYGGIVEIWAPWTGRAVGFEFGWAVGAVYIQRKYDGKIHLSLTRTDDE